MPRRLSDGAQLGVDRSRVLASCLAHPFRNGHSLPRGNALVFSRLIVVREDLGSFGHTDRLIDAYRVSRFLVSPVKGDRGSDVAVVAPPHDAPP